MTARHGLLAALATAALLSTACLQKETAHTLCLSPDGQVTWIASETNVHSDITDAAQRQVEELEYLAAASAGRHKMAAGLQALQPVGPVRTRILRDEAPFFVVTDAKFQSIEDVMRRLFEDVPGTASVSLTSENGRWTLTIAIDFSVEREEQKDDPVNALLEDLEHLRIVMTSGRFVDASGFELTDRALAKISDDWLKVVEKIYADKGRTELTLTWEAGPV